MAITVYIADDHPMLLKGIKDLITGGEGLEWIGSAKDGKVALEEIKSFTPDIAILDIIMPKHTGLDVVELLVAEKIKTRFILFTLYNDEEVLNKALKLGVSGFMLKESSEHDILACIHAVADGRIYIDPLITQNLTSRNKEKSDFLSRLSDHEVNILKLISRQKQSAEIADMLFISPRTVARHRSNISKKLNLAGVQNGLLKWAMEHKDLLD